MQGLTLAIPEMVPFRLTQNLVDAFGVSGYKGAFHRACEVTLQVYTGPDGVALLKFVRQLALDRHLSAWKHNQMLLSMATAISTHCC